MELIFYVNGIQTIVSADPGALLIDVAQAAINQTSKVGLLAKDFICLCDNNFLDFKSKINQQVILSKYGERTRIPIIIENQAIFLISNSRSRLVIKPVNPY